MARARRFQVDARRVVHETIDGETILIQLETGSYYSLGGCGPEIWGLLSDGWSDAEVVSEMQRRHVERREVVGEATRGLVRELAREELLEERDADRCDHAGTPADSPEGRPFVAPVFQKYTDMQYFLLLDPIHEVEAAGWPHERSAAPPGG